MTPKEKAKELANKFLRTYKVSLYPPFNKASDEAKECALIAVDLLLDEIFFGDETYWYEVKEEIEKL